MAWRLVFMSGCVDAFILASGIYVWMCGVWILVVWRLVFMSGCLVSCCLASGIYVWMCGFF